MINSVMNRLQDFTFFSQLMANANMGWWKANLSTANYECSDFIVELLGLDQTGVISFEDFNKRIQKEEQLSTTVHSYGVYQRPEVVYLLDTVKGAVWVRSKVCFQETDEDGNEIIYGISEVQDGPDMASAYQALQYSERLLSNIFKYLPIGIELYDMDGVLVDLNDKELEMFHLQRKEDLLGININADKTETTVAYNKIQEFESFFELIGNYAKVGYAHYDLLTRQGDAQHSWYINIGEQEGTPLSRIIGVYRHIHPEDRRAMLGFLNNAAKGMEDKFNKEVRVLREDGSYTWTHVNLIVKTYAPERNSVELICINYDITRLKTTEAMLIDAKEKAEESDRLKSAFLANMSHEIRTPLNAIIGFSSLLPHIEDAEERNHYISLINHNNELLLNIINDVLDLSKIEAGHIELAPVWCNLSDLIDESCTECQPNVPEGVTLKKRYPATPNLIKQDPMRIKQVLSNLISNALKNTVQGYVEISYETTPSETRISVSDTGRGIPEDKLGIIFERFEKADAFIQGAGLGLPICKSIMEHMNGTIEVTSTVNKGSTFTVVFPCQVRPME